MKSHIHKAFLETYELHADAIYRHCFFRVFSKQRAEELMQEAFMKTWQYLEDGHDVENIRAFVYRVANNLVIDQSRKKKEHSLEAVIEDYPAFEPSTAGHEDMERSVLMHEVRASMDELPEEQRDLLIMRYVDDLDPKDIAAVLGITPNNVSVKLNRAMAQLKEKFNHA